MSNDDLQKEIERAKQEIIAGADKYDSDDPRSIRYIRKLNRPTINWGRIVLYAIAVFGIAFSIGYLINTYKNHTYAIIRIIIYFLTIIVLFGKRMTICCVKIYQRYAPISIRNSCRFEPSCSEYSIQAFEKYGLIKGAVLTVKRLKRCNRTGGGFDYLQ
jgi:putative membrane protein insertion efficiency factor